MNKRRIQPNVNYRLTVAQNIVARSLQAIKMTVDEIRLIESQLTEKEVVTLLAIKELTSTQDWFKTREVFDQMKAMGLPHSGRLTVYRSIDVLRQMGYINPLGQNKGLKVYRYTTANKMAYLLRRLSTHLNGLLSRTE